jgi:hypothetical protein
MTAHHDQLGQHVWSAVRRYGHEALELEWRLGHKQGSFRPGVGAAAWERLRAVLDASPAFTKSCADTVELLPTGTNMKRIVANGSDTWIRKTRVGDVDIDASGPWTVRGSVSIEEAVHPRPACETMYERRKSRLSYRHHCWRIDLTRVRSNLPSHLDEDEDIFEVEIELADPGMLFERTVDNLVDWGWRMSREVCGLMLSRKGDEAPRGG